MNSTILSKMIANRYINQTIGKYTPTLGFLVAPTVINAISPVIGRWAGYQLDRIVPSGSFSKGTAIKFSTDLDIFISLKSDTQETLKDIYYSLNQKLTAVGYTARLQNVSIGITHNRFKIDLTPGVKRPFPSSDHSIYRRKVDTWTQTNILKHNNYVKLSGRVNEIRATKIWRELNSLEFPSFYLELTVIDALSGCQRSMISDNLWKVLIYLSDKFLRARVIDPANTNNVVSDDLSYAEKQQVAQKAKQSLNQTNWNKIIW
jgi:hypothetical protein